MKQSAINIFLTNLEANVQDRENWDVLTYNTKALFMNRKENGYYKR